MIKPSICIAGKNRIAIEGLKYVLKHYLVSHNIYAVPNQNDEGVDTWQPSYLKFATESPSVNVITLAEAAKLSPLVFISLEFDKIVRPGEFASKNLFNLHLSLLPKYKGMYTSAHPILNAETEGGCTLHKIDPGIDTGDIIAQISFAIDESDTSKDLYKKNLTHGTKLFLQTADSLIQGTFHAIKQPSIGSSYFSKHSIDYKNISINTHCTAYQIKKQLQAYTFRDFQLPTFCGKPIFGSRISVNKSTLKPGEIVYQDEHTLTLSTIDYDLVLFQDRFEELILSVKTENLDQITQIVNENRALIKETTKEGWTPLMIAAFNGYHASLEKLLSLGSDPNESNQKGTTPLMYAKSYAEKSGDLEGIKRLIERGASIDAKDYREKTVLDYLNEQSPIYPLLFEKFQTKIFALV